VARPRVSKQAAQIGTRTFKEQRFIESSPGASIKISDKTETDTLLNYKYCCIEVVEFNHYTYLVKNICFFGHELSQDYHSS